MKKIVILALLAAVMFSCQLLGSTTVKYTNMSSAFATAWLNSNSGFTGIRLDSGSQYLTSTFYYGTSSPSYDIEPGTSYDVELRSVSSNTWSYDMPSYFTIQEGNDYEVYISTSYSSYYSYAVSGVYYSLRTN